MIKINKKAINSVKKKEGITLIALVVTIVVLLILAGVSLNLVLGNNGIITKAQDAKLMTRAGSAEDEVELWKSDNYIARTSNQATVDKETMLQGLKDKNLVYEEEIDRDNEIITIKKKDGTIVKEINYSGVIINISKTPETEKSGAVVLQVTSVEGLTNISIKSEEEINSFVEKIERMDEESKKDLIKRLNIIGINKFSGKNIKTFEEMLEFHYTNGYITEATEEAYWDKILTDTTYTDVICDMIETIFYDEQTKSITTYEILNPNNELSDTYLATSNGTYTFLVKDLLTGKTYTKSVEVTNIDDSLDYYVANFPEEQLWGNGKNAFTRLASLQSVKTSKRPGYLCIGLRDKNDNNFTTFEQAYIIYNDTKTDISDDIETKDTYNYLNTWKLYDEKNIEDGEYVFVLVKDGIEYMGMVKVGPVSQ